MSVLNRQFSSAATNVKYTNRHMTYEEAMKIIKSDKTMKAKRIAWNKMAEQGDVFYDPTYDSIMEMTPNWPTLYSPSVEDKIGIDWVVRKLK